MPALSPVVLLHVNKKDKTGDFSPFLQTFTWSNNLHGASDGIELVLEDRDGRWNDEWYPVKGSSVQAHVGYEGFPLLYCGEFQIDEVELSGPPDTVRVNGLGTFNQLPLRTKKSKVWEKPDGISVVDVVEKIASDNKFNFVCGLTQAEKKDEAYRWASITQNRESDLAFLQRLADLYHFAFTIKGDTGDSILARGTLYFFPIESSYRQHPILVLNRQDLSRYSFRDKVLTAKGKNSHFNADTKALETDEESEASDRHGDGVDSVRVHHRTEKPVHSKRLAHAALKRHKGFEREAAFTLPGNTKLVAGLTVEAKGFGGLDDLWLIKESRHTVDRSSGYKTELTLQRVPPKEG